MNVNCHEWQLYKPTNMSSQVANKLHASDDTRKTFGRVPCVLLPLPLFKLEGNPRFITYVIYMYDLTCDQMILSPQCGVYTEYTHRKSFDLWANWEINYVNYVYVCSIDTVLISIPHRYKTATTRSIYKQLCMYRIGLQQIHVS